MNKPHLIALFLILLPVTVFSQAAGNYFYNQKRSVSYEGEMDYGGMTASNQAAYQQTYAYNQWTTVYADSVMSIQADVLMNVKPDAYTMALGLTQVGENLEEAHNKINTRINSLKTGLAEMNLPEEAIFVDFISQAPIFGMEVEKKLFSKNYVQVPAGFEVKKNVHLRFDDIETLEQIITLAAEQEIYDILTVKPLVLQRDVIYDSLRNECTAIIKSKRDQAKALGIDINPEFSTLDEKSACSYPINHYVGYTSYLDHTRQRLRKDDRMVSASGNINLYYKGKSDVSFDKVIHPELTGPVVQLSLSMRLIYTMHPESAE
ncbi:MAG TPA: SIMPL domain-containing protein [Bacteroidales bacterium]|nr:SIMPL domain-containing protein [Bacteroidales bacterium]